MCFTVRTVRAASQAQMSAPPMFFTHQSIFLQASQILTVKRKRYLASLHDSKLSYFNLTNHAIAAVIIKITSTSNNFLSVGMISSSWYLQETKSEMSIELLCETRSKKQVGHSQLFSFSSKCFVRNKNEMHKEKEKMLGMYEEVQFMTISNANSGQLDEN